MNTLNHPARRALDHIAALCGSRDWDYPAQVERDVRAVVAERDAARERLAELEVERDELRSPPLDAGLGHHEPSSGLTRNHYAGWSGARSVEAAILAVADGAAERAVWVICDHPTAGSTVYTRVVIGHGHDSQCGWRWRWCGERDEPFSASSSTICESDAERAGETRCIAIVAAHLAATAERLHWTTHQGQGGKRPWIYRQPAAPGPRAPSADG